MKQRWICQSRISNTSHQRPPPHCGTPARHGPSRCSPELVPSQTTRSLPEKIQFKVAYSWAIDLNVPPTSPNNLPIWSLPVARPHLGKQTCASSANSSRIDPPLDVTPPVSSAFRYSSATDLRCSSVMVCLVSAMETLLCSREQTQLATGRNRRHRLVVDDHQLVLGLRALDPLTAHQRRLGDVAHRARAAELHRADDGVEIGRGHRVAD